MSLLTELSAITIANITFGKIDDAKASYSGCIKDLTLNDNVFALEDAEILIDVEEQCMKKVVCTVNTCSHRGVCEDLWDKARSVKCWLFILLHGVRVI